MQQTEQTNGLETAERRRVETVVETLATLHGQGETLAEVAHDARNMVTALGLYCDLLDEPGVLDPQFRHYGNELRLVATASRRLVEKLIQLDTRETPAASRAEAARAGRNDAWEMLPAIPIGNLAREVLASRNLLSALAGPAIALTVETEGGALPVRLTSEDLTRVLVNLVRNAAEAMPSGGRIRITLCQRPKNGVAESLVLTVEDSGAGIPEEALESVFASGYTTHAARVGEAGPHRGLGLAISRSIIEAAGGRIRALNRAANGACLEIVLPVNTR